MSVVLLSSDLAVLSRIEGAAARLGKSVRIANTFPQVTEHCSTGAASMLIIDLSLPTLNIAALATHLKSSDRSATRVVAFGPHVHEERLAAAREAGCDQVVSRGQFFTQLDAILQQ